MKSVFGLARDHAPRVHAFLLMLVAAVTVMPVGTAYAVSDTYMFRNTLGAVEGSGNALVATFNNGAFVNGSFVDTTIDANVCSGTPTVRGWSFPQYGGLSTPNNSPAVVGGSYTISMIVKFNPMRSGYSRLIDFSNSTSDNGIYELNGLVSLYPVGTFAPGSFVDNQYSFVTITRDGATKVVSVFVGTTPAGTYTDTTDLYIPLAQNVIFLMDNTTGSAAISESSPGVITYLKLINTPVTSVDIAALQVEACNSVVAPTVTAVVPSSGPTAGGTTVTITGTKLTGATAVKFGGNAAASFTIDSDTQITATSPAGGPGVVDVTVTTGNGTSATSANDQFTYVAAALPTLSINNVNANEGNIGTTPFVFTVTLSAASASTVTVNYATADGTATAGSDYVAASGTLTFNPGVLTQTITVNVNGDTAVEPNETFLVNLSTPVNATIVTGTGTGTIVNDDAVQPATNAVIPTLSTWGLVALAMLLALLAIQGFRTRRR